MQLNTYINFGGNCEEAFQFYEKHLGGKITFMMRWEEMPEPRNIPSGQDKKILHGNMTLGGTQLMGADVPAYQPMRSAYLTLRVDTDEEVERLYNSSPTAARSS